jgi:hypothetical protein
MREINMLKRFAAVAAGVALAVGMGSASANAATPGVVITHNHIKVLSKNVVIKAGAGTVALKVRLKGFNKSTTYSVYLSDSTGQVVSAPADIKVHNGVEVVKIHHKQDIPTVVGKTGRVTLTLTIQGKIKGGYQYNIAHFQPTLK